MGLPRIQENRQVFDDEMRHYGRSCYPLPKASHVPRGRDHCRKLFAQVLNIYYMLSETLQRVEGCSDYSL